MDSYFLIQNERVKIVSNTVMGWGALLFPASIARLILNDGDWVGISWLAGSIVLLVGGVWLLGALEA